MFEAHLNNAIFEPSPGTLPDIQSIATASGLEEMTYEHSPTSLVELEQAFRAAGLRLQANEVHYAVMRSRRIHAGFFEKILLLAVEIPCGYGLQPGRPLLFLLAAILAFWIPYLFALNDNGSGGIWIVWSDDRANKDAKTEKNGRLSPVGIRRVAAAFYFSVVSAFNIGWEEINIGSWIGRLQPKEFTLKAVGWVRVVAGVQSLLGVYMVALAILSYFGHIFE